MNYEKLTVERFAQGLKDGKYKAIAGARRAIGKVQGWSAKEKASANELANKHFGASASGTVPKTTGKTKNKPGPKPGKKAKKATAKKAAAAPKQVARAEQPARAPFVAKTSEPKPAKPQVSGSVGSHTDLNMANSLIEFTTKVRVELAEMKRAHSTLDFAHVEANFPSLIAKAVKLAGGEKMEKVEEKKAAPTPAPKPTPTPAAKPVEKKAAPVHVPTPAPSTPSITTGAPIAQAKPEDVPPPVPVITNEAIPTSDVLSEEERKVLGLKPLAPVSATAGLPRPANFPVG